MSEIVNNNPEGQNEKEIFNLYGLPEETVQECMEQCPHGETVMPIGVTVPLNPKDQCVVMPIGCSYPPEGWTPPEDA